MDGLGSALKLGLVAWVATGLTAAAWIGAQMAGVARFGVDPRPMPWSLAHALLSVFAAILVWRWAANGRAGAGIPWCGMALVTGLVAQLITIRVPLLVASLMAAANVPLLVRQRVRDEASALSDDPDTPMVVERRDARASVLAVVGLIALSVASVFVFRSTRAPEVGEHERDWLPRRPFPSQGPRLATLPDGSIHLTQRASEAPDLRWAQGDEKWKRVVAADHYGGPVTLATLSDGSLLRLTSTKYAQRLDAGAEQWRVVGDSVRVAPLTTLRLGDGRFLVLGQKHSRFFASDAWTAGPESPDQLDDAVMAEVEDGVLLVAGEAKERPRAWLLPHGASGWEEVRPPRWPRLRMRALTLLDGRVLLTGFQRANLGAVGDVHPVAEVYDPSRDRWRATGDLPQRIDNWILSQCSETTVLAVGTDFGPGAEVDTPRRGHALTLDVESGRWTDRGRLGRNYLWLTGTVLLDRSIVVTGDESVHVERVYCPED